VRDSFVGIIARLLVNAHNLEVCHRALSQAGQSAPRVL
jgi:hypothetical protein